MRLSALPMFLAAGVVPSMAVNAAFDPIPKENGFSGAVGAISGYTSHSSNLIAGDGSKDYANSVVKSLDQDSKTKSKASLNPYLDLRYTFAETGTQIVLGNQVQDAVRFDMSQLLGVRQQTSVGVFSTALLFSVAPSELWQDPYLKNRPRVKTDRDNRGIRVQWEQIANSGFSLMFSRREIELDKDYAGVDALQKGEITFSEQQLLRRDGDVNRVQLSYDHFFSEQSMLSASIDYEDRDIEGKAMAGDGYRTQFTYLFFGDDWTTSVNVLFGRREHEKSNPLFGKKLDSDEYGGALTLFKHGLAGYDNLSLIASAAYYRSDSKVTFHDMEGAMFNLGVIYKF